MIPIEQLSKLYNIDIQNNPQELFDILSYIINFDCACVYIADKPVYHYNYEKLKDVPYKLSENLTIKGVTFGKIELGQGENFTEKDKENFKICALILSNIIKDVEMTKIINLQIEALQEGILETKEAYKSEKDKNDFFANFSHELRTPLNSIISSSELLCANIFGELNEKQQEYVSDIRIAGLHLLGMINDILDMAKIESHSMKLNITEFKLSIAINEVLNILKPLADKKNIGITKDCCEELTLKADYQKIEQILFNIISNAIKYTPNGGKVDITVKQDNDIKIFIQDNGIGIDKKYHKKIFEKFFQLGTQKNSNGLGLTITKELVKLHNGKINIESKPQEGTCFIITFPKIA